MGARDELFTGRSTLLLELEEAQVILNCATQHSLVLMDELGRGTSSCDGAAIATATLHHLVTQACLVSVLSLYYSGQVFDLVCESLSIRHATDEGTIALCTELSRGVHGETRCVSMIYVVVFMVKPGVSMIHGNLFMVKPDDDGKAVTLLYSVVEGLANESFGLNVARLADIRADVLSRASHYTDILQSRAESSRWVR
uniref:DNA mismatch repair proteins mutS family domain-containing protein n=1 Tax=Timema douglasi TaxID=61478 RepID=A0A7R8VLR7_TIMDO|nr:unnamed protein product [Timema douglasi]